MALARRWGWTRAQALERIEGLAERVRANIQDVVRSSGLMKDRQDHFVSIVSGNISLLLG